MLWDIRDSAYWNQPIEERRIDDIIRIVRLGRSTEDGPTNEDEVRRYIASKFGEVSAEAIHEYYRINKEFGK